MTAAASNRRDRLRARLADLKMPGALEALDGVLAQVDSGTVTAGDAIEQVLNAQIALRNNRRLQAAMRSSRPAAASTTGRWPGWSTRSWRPGRRANCPGGAC